TFPNGEADIYDIGGDEVGRLVFQPGWRWSNDLKPIAKTESCEAPHFQYHVSGRLGIRMDDGTEFIAEPGDITARPKGPDAWGGGRGARPGGRLLRRLDRRKGGRGLARSSRRGRGLPPPRWGRSSFSALGAPGSGPPPPRPAASVCAGSSVERAWIPTKPCS